MIDRSLKKKLVQEDRWSRTYQVGESFFASESKFEADCLSVSVDELSAEWDSWTAADRISFVNAFGSKTKFSKSDEKVLEFLMVKGDDAVWCTIALSLTRHSNKNMVLNFLLEKINSLLEPRANFIQALYVIGDMAAVPSLRTLHDQLSKRIMNPASQADRWTIFDFLRCCEALNYLERTQHYQDEIRMFLSHPDEQVRNQAQIALAGPQPEEFGPVE